MKEEKTYYENLSDETRKHYGELDIKKISTLWDSLPSSDIFPKKIYNKHGKVYLQSCRCDFCKNIEKKLNKK